MPCNGGFSFKMNWGRRGEIMKANNNGNADNLQVNYLYNASLAGAAILGNTFNFTLGKNEIFPIPQIQIDLSHR